MTVRPNAMKAFLYWYEHLQEYSAFPAKGTIAGALVVLDHLQDDFDLDINSHTAKGGSQVRGASGAGVKAILEKFGETRPFVREGGRTNRGLRGDIKAMLEAIEAAGLAKMRVGKRNETLRSFQQFLVARVQDFHNLQRLEIVYDPVKTTSQLITDLLENAADVGKEGPVAQYLVGAKLQLRFPNMEISNESYSTADKQLGRHGDFHVGDTVFHVTIAPMIAVYEKCKRNLEQGLKVYLLVPDGLVAGTKQNAELQAAGKIAVQSIESFVGQNIDELSRFSNREASKAFRRLLEIYNERVDSSETNKSMMIEIPANL